MHQNLQTTVVKAVAGTTTGTHTIHSSILYCLILFRVTSGAEAYPRSHLIKAWLGTVWQTKIAMKKN